MKSEVLAACVGARLTRVTNTHLLPLNDCPMLFYPLLTLGTANVTDTVSVTGNDNAGSFLKLHAR
jgi:dTDP-glucose pyrophosphorylase